MELFLTYIPLFILLYGFTYYTVVQMKKFGTIFILLTYLKWFIGVSVTFFAFYTIHISSIFFKEHNLTILLSLPVGVAVWYIPMNYLSNLFQKLEDKFRKESN